jgi:hypothetical protein
MRADSEHGCLHVHQVLEHFWLQTRSITYTVCLALYIREHKSSGLQPGARELVTSVNSERSSSVADTLRCHSHMFIVQRVSREHGRLETQTFHWEKKKFEQMLTKFNINLLFEDCACK